MKAQENDRVRTLVEVRSDLAGRVWPAGTEGTVMDVSGGGRYYAVDVGENEGEYDNIMLTEDQFTVIQT